MSITLNLCDHLLARARRLQEMGRLMEALRALEQLTDLQPMSRETAEQAQAALGEIHLKRRRYRRARRHLLAALAFNPNNARYHYLLARAYRADCRVLRALDHYRQSLEQDAKQVKRLTEYGLLLVRDNRIAEGLKHLRKAVRLAPESAEVAANLAKGLRLAGRAEEAQDVARAALFRNPRSASYLSLWRDHQFRLAASAQSAKRRDRVRRAKLKEPVLLPFLRTVGDSARATDDVRQDGPATLSPPHFTRSKRRHVQ